MLEPNAAGGEPVEVRRLRLGMPVTVQRIVQVVGNQKKDVGPDRLVCDGEAARTKQAETKSSVVSGVMGVAPFAKGLFEIRAPFYPRWGMVGVRDTSTLGRH